MVTVNAMGDKCPVPVIKTKKALDALTAPETIEVLVDNETAVANVTKMAQSTGATVTQEKLGEDEYKVTIQALAGEGTQTAPAGAVCDCVPTGDTVVVISSDKMGSGNDELGKVLIKGCIFAITQLDELPKKMIFYNGGAKITCEGSDSLEDLKNLESQVCPEGAGALKAAVLLLFGVVRDAQQDAVIVLAQIFFKACNHLGEEGICQIRHDQQHRAAFAALEAARHLIGHIVHFLRRSQDLFLGLGIHQRAVRKCP